MSDVSPNVTDCALVFEGGGYRASYTAGMANVLLEHGIRFGFVCGISAGASHTIDYVSNDTRRVRDGFIQLSDRRPQAGGKRSFLMGHGYFNADYDYVGCVKDGYMPFDWEGFAENPAQVRIQSFEADTGRSVSWGKEDFSDVWSMLEHVRASSTLPGIMNPISIDGHVMYDGGIGRDAGIPVRLAEDAGFERIVYVATRPRGYRKDESVSAATRRLYRKISHGFDAVYEALITRGERYNAAIDHVLELERAGRLFLWCPDIMPVKSTTITRPELEASYELGHRQALRDLPRVREFLFGSADAGPDLPPEETERLVAWSYDSSPKPPWRQVQHLLDEEARKSRRKGGAR